MSMPGLDFMDYFRVTKRERQRVRAFWQEMNHEASAPGRNVRSFKTVSPTYARFHVLEGHLKGNWYCTGGGYGYESYERCETGLRHLLLVAGKIKPIEIIIHDEDVLRLEHMAYRQRPLQGFPGVIGFSSTVVFFLKKLPVIYTISSESVGISGLTWDEYSGYLRFVGYNNFGPESFFAKRRLSPDGFLKLCQALALLEMKGETNSRRYHLMLKMLSEIGTADQIDQSQANIYNIIQWRLQGQNNQQDRQTQQQKQQRQPKQVKVVSSSSNKPSRPSRKTGRKS